MIITLPNGKQIDIDNPETRNDRILAAYRKAGPFIPPPCDCPKCQPPETAPKPGAGK